MTDKAANVSLNNRPNISQQQNTQNVTTSSPRESISISSQSPSSEAISINSHDLLNGASRSENLSGSQTSPSQLSKSEHMKPPPQYTPEDPNIKNDDSCRIDVGGEIDKAQEINDKLQTDRQIRMAFVRKVYGLLTLQLLTTIAISSLFIFCQPVKDFVSNNQLYFYISWIAAFVILILLFWQRKRYPLNLILLLLFTLSISYGIGSIVSLYSQQVVLQAFLITFGVFIALEIFTLQSKWDFSSWGPFLYATLWVVIFAFIVGWFIPSDHGYHIAISSIAALIFSAYIIYDTYMLFDRVSPEEYILAAVDLYLDILNLFVAIFAILVGACDS